MLTIIFNQFASGGSAPPPPENGPNLFFDSFSDDLFETPF